jgi:hypothetical protein
MSKVNARHGASRKSKVKNQKSKVESRKIQVENRPGFKDIGPWTFDMWQDFKDIGHWTLDI